LHFFVADLDRASGRLAGFRAYWDSGHTVRLRLV